MENIENNKNNQKEQSTHLPTKEEMLRGIKSAMLEEQEWYNMWDFRQVFIWDVLKYMKVTWFWAEEQQYSDDWDLDSDWRNIRYLLSQWCYKDKSIQEQPEDCIRFVFSLTV